MPGWRPESPSAVVLLATARAVILCLIWLGTGEASQEFLVNCNEVIQGDRCACNERILLALTQNRPIFIDPTEGGNPREANAAIAIEQERYHQLRTFYAPACEEPRSSPAHLPVAPQHTGSWLDQKAIENHLRPLGAKTIDSVAAQTLLPGRWQGWQTLPGRKATPVFFHVVSVEANGRFVKACSDQGMVFGRVRDGYLEFPRSDFSDLAYSIRLWTSSAPRSRDLEGVILLEMRPSEVVVAGLVWLSRAVRFDWSTPASSYFCQDRDLEERRQIFREKQERARSESPLRVAE